MKSRTLKCITAITLFAALAVPVRLAAQHTRHKPREIRTSGGPSSGSVAVGTHPLNNAVARGGAHTPTPDSNAPNCFGECYNSGANDINANGVVTGISQDGAINPITGLLEFDTVVWKDGQIINLGTFGGNWSYANATNNRGQVAGFALNTTPDSITTDVLATGNGSSGARATPPFAAKLSSETLAGARGEPGDGRHGDDVAPSDSEQVDVFGAAQQDYLHRAYPAAEVSVKDTLNAQKAWTNIKAKGLAIGQNDPGSWTLIGPSIANFPAILTFSGHDYTTSGRASALAIAPNCSQAQCRIYVGAAGGGIWRADNGLATSPNWTFVSGSFTTNAIGTMTLDPSDPTGNTLYVGTGEPNASGDSEAGFGIYKTTDGGDTWTHLAASTSIASQPGCGATPTIGPYSGPAFDARSISSIVINGSTIYVGSARGVRGVAVPTGGTFSLNPNFPPIGIWKSTDGGSNFTLIGNPTAVCLNPLLPGGAVISSFGSGRGVNHVEVDPNTASTIYAAAFGTGIFRSPDSGSNWDKIFNPGTTSSIGRTEFAATALDATHTRVYVGDGANSSTLTAFYRSDNATRPVSELFDGTSNVGWKNLTSSDRTNPYYATFNYCTGQCWYDNFVVTPPGHPDEVFLGGSYQYGEYGFRSNGRAVLRSTNAGEKFTDMTWDATIAPAPAGSCCDPTPYAPNGIHPDQHALVVNPNNTGMFFESSDGGVVRSSGRFTDISSQCDSRPLSAPSLAACHNLLSSVPSHLHSSNKGLSTLQFSTLSVDPTNAKHLMGGTQDNGTFETYGSPVTWPQIIYGDGGESGFDSGNPAIRFNQFFLGFTDTNFQNGDPTKWVVISGPILQSHERINFYWAELMDPKVSGTMYTGLQHVWRTLDNGGSQSYLEANCPEFTTPGDDPACGDWVQLGGGNGDLTSSYWGDRDLTLGVGSIVSQVERWPGDTSSMWASTDSGRLFITNNADATNPDDVTYTRLDSLASNDPNRYISSIYIDPANKNHAWISYSGYNAHTPSTPGHVFEVTYNPGAGTATWTDLSYNLGDLPVTDLVRDDKTGDLYAANDFGVTRLANGVTAWTATNGMPMVEVSHLTIVPGGRLLYAATHGRSAWSLTLP